MHQSIPAAPSPHPPLLPRADPRALAFFFCLRWQIPGGGDSWAVKFPELGTKKEGKCPVLRQHCSLRGRCLKRKGKGVFGRERIGAREERGKETPARKPLFSPSRLLIMYAKITQLWMTSCQISLAATPLFLAIFSLISRTVFLLFS